MYNWLGIEEFLFLKMQPPLQSMNFWFDDRISFKTCAEDHESLFEWLSTGFYLSILIIFSHGTAMHLFIPRFEMVLSLWVRFHFVTTWTLVVTTIITILWLVTIKCHNLLFTIEVFFFFLGFFLAYGSSQVRGQIRPAVGLCHSYSSAISKAHMWSTPQLAATLDP